MPQPVPDASDAGGHVGPLLPERGGLRVELVHDVLGVRLLQAVPRLLRLELQRGQTCPCLSAPHTHTVPTPCLVPGL